MIKKVNEQDQQTKLFYFEGRREIGLIFSSSKSCLYPDLTALTLKC